MKAIALSLLALTLAACTTPPSEPKPSSGEQLAQAATTPLNDLNLVRAEIPPVLAAAQKAPYAMPADRSCDALAKDVQALDATLGADLDIPATAANPSLVERGGDTAMGAVRDAAGSIVPFRGWVRKLTGAERYAREGPPPSRPVRSAART
jgi:hypothetical protein